MTGFDKTALLNLMAYPNEISDQELEQLNAVLLEYPYFQLGHSLVAKARHDKQTHDAHDALTHAAIYAPDRNLLRSLFYEDLKIDNSLNAGDTPEDSFPADNAQNTDEDAHQAEDVDQPNISPDLPENYELHHENKNPEDKEQVIESDEVYNELEENLRKLRASKNKFSEDESETDNKKKITDQPAEPSDKPSTEKKSEHEIAPLLMDLIKDSDEEEQSMVYGNSKQNELIDKFINADSTVWLDPKKTGSQKEEKANDLSEKSVSFDDDVITENLAEIYHRQGRKDKAIEIYHKLIWKFPQKKAYFAEIIENLKAE